MVQPIPREKAIQRLRIENPWWEAGQIEGLLRVMTRRAYFNIFYELVRERSVRRAVVLMGPRRVGKTVLLHHTIQALLESGTQPKSVAYISVDHPLYTGWSLDDLIELCTEAASCDEFEYVIFDEIQYLRDWERHLKALVDTSSKTRFIASGSAAAALRLKSIESGAGRFTTFVLPPLTFHESLLLGGNADIVQPSDGDQWPVTSDIDRLNQYFLEYLNFGGYPEAVTSEVVQRDPARFIKSDIIDKVLLRDLPSLYGIHDIQELNALFTSLAYNTASEMSLERLSQSSGVAKNTIKRYIGYLEAAFLLRRVSRIDRNARRFKRQTAFKVYLTNPSIRAALFSPVSADDPDTGNLVETAMYSQWFHGDHGTHHYARWDSGEVDMVYLAKDGAPSWVAESKWSNRPLHRPREELSPVLKFCHQHRLGEALVTTRSEQARKTIDGIAVELVPASVYCYTIGYNVSMGRSEDMLERLKGTAIPRPSL